MQVTQLLPAQQRAPQVWPTNVPQQMVPTPLPATHGAPMPYHIGTCFACSGAIPSIPYSGCQPAGPATAAQAGPYGCQDHGSRAGNCPDEGSTVLPSCGVVG